MLHLLRSSANGFILIRRMVSSVMKLSKLLLGAGAALKGFDETFEGLFKPSRGDHLTGRVLETLDHDNTVDLAVQVRVEERRVIGERHAPVRLAIGPSK